MKQECDNCHEYYDEKEMLHYSDGSKLCPGCDDELYGKDVYA